MVNDFSETLERLKNRIADAEKDWGGIAVFEAILVLIIGVASSNLYHEKYALFFLCTLIFVAILYLIIKARRFFYDKKYPSALVQELEAKYKLEHLEGKLKRVVSSNEVINEVIVNMHQFDYQGLMRKIEKEENENIVVDNIIRISQDLFKPLSQNIHVLLDNKYEKSSIGLVFTLSLSEKRKTLDNFPIIMLRDEYNLFDDIPENIRSTTNLKGWQLEFQSFIRSSQNNNCFEINPFKKELSELRMICTPISGEKKMVKLEGVVFALTPKNNEPIPIDLESKMKIFSNLLALWIEQIASLIISKSGLDILEGFEVLREFFTKEFKRWIKERKEQNDDNQKNIRNKDMKLF